jgi:hypothetical protein
MSHFSNRTFGAKPGLIRDVRVADAHVSLRPWNPTRAMHHCLWLSMFLMPGMACSLGDVYAQESGRGDQPTTPGGQTGEKPGQGGMGERGQMT